MWEGNWELDEQTGLCVALPPGPRLRQSGRGLGFFLGWERGMGCSPLTQRVDLSTTESSHSLTVAVSTAESSRSLTRAQLPQCMRVSTWGSSW